MKQQRFCGLISVSALVTVFLTSSSVISYAGSGPRAITTRPLTTVPRAFLALDAQGPGTPDPLSHLASINRNDSVQDLAYKISFVGGLILTADRLIRAADSMRETNLFSRGDGSCVRLNTEPTSKGF